MALENRMGIYIRKVQRPDGTHIIRSDNKDIANAVALSKGVGKSLGNQKEEWESAKRLQKEFQEKYCPTCLKYDPLKNDFIKKGNTNNPDDCKSHWTDPLGECANYEKRA